MKSEIETWIIANYYELLVISKRITRGHELSNDLLQDVLLQLYERPTPIILNQYNDNQIRYFITGVLRINWLSKTSPFHYRMRKESSNYVPLTDRMIDDVEDNSYLMEREELLTSLENAFTELEWFRKSILEMYLTLGSLKSVSKKTGIPLTSISRYVKEAKNIIKDDINNQLYGDK